LLNIVTALLLVLYSLFITAVAAVAFKIGMAPGLVLAGGVVAIAGAAGFFYWILPELLRYHRGKRHCLHCACRYDLRATPGRCPECGKPAPLRGEAPPPPLGTAVCPARRAWPVVRD
jgi:hypothetical protein